jgi:hypothetical protein
LLADAFAAEAAAALHQAADDMPQAAMAQVNGRQMKNLKKKQKAAAVASALPEQASVAEQKHQAQLAGAAEAVPLRLKQEKLAQRRSDTDLQDMDALLQPPQLSNGKSAKKKQKKHSQGSATGAAVQHVTGKADNMAAVANGHGDSVVADGKAQDGASQKKKRVRFAMKRNLWMQIGGAVPPEEIRTPPDSRPKVIHMYCTIL